MDKPLEYADDLDDTVANLAGGVLVLNLLAGLLIKLDVTGDDKYKLPPEGTDGYSESTFEAFLVLINVTVVVFALATVTRQIFKPGGGGGAEDVSNDDDGRRQVEIEMSVAQLARQASRSGGSFSYTNPTSGAVLDVGAALAVGQTAAAGEERL